MSVTAFDETQRTFKKAKEKSILDLISFIATTIEGDQASKSTIKLAKDNLVNPSFLVAKRQKNHKNRSQRKKCFRKESFLDQGNGLRDEEGLPEHEEKQKNSKS